MEVDVLPVTALFFPEAGFFAAASDRLAGAIDCLGEANIDNQSDRIGEHAHDRRSKRCRDRFLWLNGVRRQLEIKLMERQSLNELAPRLRFKAGNVCRHQLAIGVPISGDNRIEQAFCHGHQLGHVRGFRAWSGSAFEVTHGRHSFSTGGGAGLVGGGYAGDNES